MTMVCVSHHATLVGTVHETAHLSCRFVYFRLNPINRTLLFHYTKLHLHWTLSVSWLKLPWLMSLNSWYSKSHAHVSPSRCNIAIPNNKWFIRCIICFGFNCSNPKDNFYANTFSSPGSMIIHIEIQEKCKLRKHRTVPKKCIAFIWVDVRIVKNIGQLILILSLDCIYIFSTKSLQICLSWLI